MASPQDTGAYQFVMQFGQNEDKDERKLKALRFVELEGLLVLGMLGEMAIIPTLLDRVREKPGDAKLRITAKAVLLYLTGQDIGSYFLTDEDISLWDSWWQQNNSSSN
jgi:hypothetical protein